MSEGAEVKIAIGSQSIEVTSSNREGIAITGSNIDGCAMQLILVVLGQRKDPLRNGDATTGIQQTSAGQESDQERRHIYISPSDTVSDLKAREFPRAARVRLIHRGAELREESAKLGTQCGLRDGDVLHCVVTRTVSVTAAPLVFIGGDDSLLGASSQSNNNSSSRVVYALLGSLLLLTGMIYLSLPTKSERSGDEHVLGASAAVATPMTTAVRRVLVAATVAAASSGLLILLLRRPRRPR